MVIVIILWSLVSWSAAPWPSQRCGRHSAVAGTARWLAQRTGPARRGKACVAPHPARRPGPGHHVFRPAGWRSGPADHVNTRCRERPDQEILEYGPAGPDQNTWDPREATGLTETRTHSAASRAAGRWEIFNLLVLSQFMIVLDAGIVNVALESIRRDLGFAPADLAWVMDAYMLALGGFLLLGGRIADLVGRRRLILAGLVLFTLASLACGLST